MMTGGTGGTTTTAAGERPFLAVLLHASAAEAGAAAGAKVPAAATGRQASFGMDRLCLSHASAALPNTVCNGMPCLCRRGRSHHDDRMRGGGGHGGGQHGGHHGGGHGNGHGGGGHGGSGGGGLRSPMDDDDDHFVSKYATLEEVEGKVAEVAQDQNGCRFLQKKFDEGGPAAISMVFAVS